MLLGDVLLPLAFGELRTHPQEVEGTPRVAVLLRREGRDELEHAIRRGAVLEGEPRAVGEDVVELVRVVWREGHLLVGQPRAHTRIEVFREGQLVRDADQRDARLRQVVVDLQELVQDVVAVLLHELVDLVQGHDHDTLLLVELLQEQAVHAIRRQARERDTLMEVLDELVPDRLEHAVRGVDDLAIQIEVLDHPRAVGLAELVLDVLDNGRLPGPRLPEDEDVARTFALQRRHQDLRELSDVVLPVRKSIRQVRRTQDLPVHLEDRPSAKVRLEDAFFHDPHAPPESEKVRLACLFSRENRAREGRYQGDPTKRFASFPCDNRCMPMAWPDFYSHPFMIGPFETGLKLHAPSNTLFVSRVNGTSTCNATLRMSITLIRCQPSPGTVEKRLTFAYGRTLVTSRIFVLASLAVLAAILITLTSSPISAVLGLAALLAAYLVLSTLSPLLTH